MEDGVPGLDTHHVPTIAFAENQRGEVRVSDIHPQLTTGGGKPGQGYPAIAFQESQSGTRLSTKHATLDANKGSRRMEGALVDMAVRRLTPMECERLQGYEDGWTAIPGAADGPRYRALGNSVAVPVVFWVASRIADVLSAPGERNPSG
jgi:DNA (cytosine-5)-methyltransferase 1